MKEITHTHTKTNKKNLEDTDRDFKYAIKKFKYSVIVGPTSGTNVAVQASGFPKQFHLKTESFNELNISS